MEFSPNLEIRKVRPNLNRIDVSRGRNLLSFLLLTLLVLSAPGWAQQPSALLLYKSSEESAQAQSRVATRVAPILEAQGFKVVYHDIDSGFPTESQKDLLVTWFASPKIADPEAYVDWLAKQSAQGSKVVILGNFGAHTKDGQTWMTDESLNRFFYPFGLKYGAAYTGDSNLLSVTTQRAPAAAPTPLNYYLLFRSTNPANRVLMEVERSDLADSKSALVVETPFGAMAQEGYVDKLDLKTFLSEIAKAEKKTLVLSKRLLGLYKSSEKVDSRTNYLARFVAPTLLDLGFGIDYHDIETGMPSVETMQKYDGVISWFQGAEMKKAGDYVEWLASQVEAQKRVVILGNFGAFAENIPTSGGVVQRYLQSQEYNDFFFPFGLEFRGAWSQEKQSVQVTQKDASMVPWLQPQHVGHYFWIRSVDPQNQTYLQVKRQDVQDSESSVVVTTPHGGLALESYVLSTDPSTGEPRFHIDLHKFLQVSLTPSAAAAHITKPDLAALESKPALAPRPKPARGGSGVYPSGVTPVKRKVLAFYHSGVNEDEALNPTYLSAQATMEHLGLIVEYHDVNDPRLPSLTEMDDYRGIVVWLGSNVIPNAVEFDAWLKQNVKAGRKIILLGDYELRDKANLSLVNPEGLFNALGFSYDALDTAPIITGSKGLNSYRRPDAQQPKVISQDSSLIGFEREINWEDKDLKGAWPLIKSQWPDSKVALTVSRRGGESDVVAITKNGAVALSAFTVWTKGVERKKATESSDASSGPINVEETGGGAWRINPYLFFAKALEVEKTPRPDVTTLNGSRIFYSHIDGDAFGGISRIDSSSLNGEVMYKRVLRELPLPITVSFVTKDIESRLNARYSRELDTAQEILKLPNVEAASHTFSHPFNWVLGDLTVDRASGSGLSLVHQSVDLAQEIKHSIDFVDKLCPEGKRCEVLLWSGRCNPTSDALAAVRQAGLINMNGGEPVFSEKYPNVAGLLPLYAQQGGETQYHVSAAGDFFYTGSWTKQYDGMKDLPDYLDRTESPRRLRAMNVYYHFYLAERQLGLDGLKVAYDDVLRRNPAPMFASEYAEILEDALETQMGTATDGRVWVKNKGICSTVRFDDESRFPDLKGSEGVIGFSRLNGSLYLHLDGSGKALIKLSATAPQSVFVQRASHRIQNWSATPRAVSFQLYGQGPATLSFGNLQPSSAYELQVDGQNFKVTTTAQGALSWNGRFDGYKQTHNVSLNM